MNLPTAKTLLAAPVVCALAAGCVVGPKYVRPDVATPPAFKELPTPTL